MRKAFFFGFTNNVMDIRKWARSRKNNSSVTRDNSMRDSHGECTKTGEMFRTLQVEKRTRVIIIQLNRRFCMILPSATTRELDKTTVEYLGGMIEPKQVVLEKSRWKRSVLSEVLFLARKVLSLARRSAVTWTFSSSRRCFLSSMSQVLEGMFQLQKLFLQARVVMTGNTLLAPTKVLIKHASSKEHLMCEAI